MTRACNVKFDSDRGQSLTEVIIVTILVAVLVIAAVRLFGRSVSCEFDSASDQIDDGTSAPRTNEGCVERSADPELGAGSDGDRPPRPSPPPLPSIEPAPSPAPSQPAPSPSASPTPEIVTFFNPQSGGAPLDNCINFGRNCGQPAADLFCQARGFRGSVGFIIGAGIPQTFVPGDGILCIAPPSGCGPFTQISCIR